MAGEALASHARLGLSLPKIVSNYVENRFSFSSFMDETVMVN